MTRAKRPGPLGLDAVRTYPLADRESKVTVADFGRPHEPGASVAQLLASLPNILGAQSLRRLVSDVQQAHERDKPILWGLGAHVLKAGPAPCDVCSLIPTTWSCP